MNLFLYLFYQFCKLLVKISLRVFYPNTTVVNRKNLRFDNPTIVVCNHPNAMIDPLHLAGRTKKLVFFLINAGLFKSKFGNWFFTTFYCIPIERPKDVAGRKIQNTDSFKKCDDHLAGGGALFIAPQGVSQWKRRLDSLKSGTARIALSAENANDFKLGVNILPIGLNYSSPYEYRSKIFINVGQPIQVNSYEKDYRIDNFGAARQITDDLATQMKTLIVDTLDQEEDDFIKKIEELQQHETPLSFGKVFHRTKKTIEQLREKEKENPDLFLSFSKNVEKYFLTLSENQINDQAVKKNISSGQKIFTAFLFLLGYPLFLYGWLNNLIAHLLPHFLVKKINTYAVYTATIKILSACFIFFPIVYSLQTWAIYQWSGNGWLALFYFLSLYPLGAFAWKYKKSFNQFMKDIKFEKQLQKSVKNDLSNIRNNIVTQLSKWSLFEKVLVE